MTDHTTTVAVVGCGVMGEKHAHAVADHPTLALDAVVDVDRERAETLAERYGAAALTDHEEALERVDAAVVATPESVHYEQATAALDRGVHLLLEKPLADDLDDARELAERAADTDLVTAVSFVLRHDPAYAEAFERARNGDLGELVAVRAERGNPLSESRRVGRRSHPTLYMSIHDVDALSTCVGSPVETVRAVERRGELADLGIPDAVAALLAFEDGTIGVLEGYGVLPDETPGGIQASFEITGTSGTVSVDTPGDSIQVVADGYDRPDTRHWPVVDGNVGGTIARQTARFAEAIAGGRDVPATIADGYEAHRVAEAIRRASETGETIELADVE